MSLLMDALKKAEKARLAQQEHADSAAQGDAELRLDPIARQPSETAEVASRASDDSPTTAGDSRETSGGLALESVDAPPSAPELGDAANEHESASFDTGESLLNEDTSATLPSIKVARASVDDYFDGTRSVSLSMEQVRSAMDDEDTAERHPAEASGRQTARTVLDAAAARPPRNAARGIVYGLLGLLLIGALGGGGYFYWRQINVPSQLFANRPPPRRVATTPTPTPVRVATPTPTPVAAATPPPVSPKVPLEQQGPALSEVLTTESPVARPAPPRGDLSPSVTPPATGPTVVSDTSVAANPIAEQAMTISTSSDGKAVIEAAGGAQPPASTFGKPAEAADALALAIAKAGLSGPGPGIRVHRGKRTKPTVPVLTAAYEAFIRGDDQSARRGYEQVLSRAPRDRDALLGLAALALRAGRVEEAAANYRKVLTLDPSDSLASAALLQMQPDLDPVRGESYLKGLLAHEPGAAWLHFNLGNLYAQQARWPQAEESYFTAYQADPENADYAYNLAVSLDHIEQRTTALSYYQRAIELADGRRVSFDAGSAMARVRVLTAAPGS